MTTARLALAFALCAAIPARVRAHAVEYAHDVEQGAGRVAVRFRSVHGGAPLAGAWVQVFAPADPRAPREEGRTDARGRYAFRPDAPGAWRVRAVDATGHGDVATVEVQAGTAPPPSGAAAGAATASGAAAPAGAETAPLAARPDGPHAGAPRVRVLGAAAAIVLAFALLAALHRRRPRV